MSQTVQQLIADFQAKNTEAKNLLGKVDFTADDDTAVKALNAQMQGLKSRIEGMKANAEMSSFLTVGDYMPMGNGGAVLGSTPSQQVAQITTDKHGIKHLEFDRMDPNAAKMLKAAIKPEYKTAFREYLLAGGSFERMPVDAMKTLQEGVDTQGGFTVPEDMLNTLIQKKPAPTSMASKVTTYQTSRDALTIPKVVYNNDDIYTTGVRVTKTGERPANATVHRVTDPVFGSVRIPVQTWMLSLPITNDLIEDSMFPLEQWVSAKFAETIDLLIENQITSGSGVAENMGLLTAILRGTSDDPGTVTTGDAAKLTPDSLFKVKRSVPPQYNNGSMNWVMNYGSTGLQVETMKDNQNRYLFRMGGAEAGGLQGDSPDALLGKPITYNQFMPDVAANAVATIYGDLSGYVLLHRIGFSIQVLREKYAEENQIVLLGRVRFGGMPVEPWKMKGLKVSA